MKDYIVRLTEENKNHVGCGVYYKINEEVMYIFTARHNFFQIDKETKKESEKLQKFKILIGKSSITLDLSSKEKFHETIKLSSNTENDIAVIIFNVNYKDIPCTDYAIASETLAKSIIGNGVFYYGKGEGHLPFLKYKFTDLNYNAEYKITYILDNRQGNHDLQEMNNRLHGDSGTGIFFDNILLGVHNGYLDLPNSIADGTSIGCIFKIFEDNDILHNIPNSDDNDLIYFDKNIEYIKNYIKKDGMIISKINEEIKKENQKLKNEEKNFCYVDKENCKSNCKYLCKFYSGNILLLYNLLCNERGEFTNIYKGHELMYYCCDYKYNDLGSFIRYINSNKFFNNEKERFKKSIIFWGNFDNEIVNSRGIENDGYTVSKKEFRSVIKDISKPKGNFDSKFQISHILRKEGIAVCHMRKILNNIKNYDGNVVNEVIDKLI